MTAVGDFSPGDILSADDLNAIGVWTSYTPVLTQNVARTATINQADYVVINKMCIVNVDLTCTTTGSGNNISVSLPLTAVTSGTAFHVGSGLFYDSSATNNVLLSVDRTTAGTEVNFTANASSTILNTTLGNNDVISFSIVYETI
jgi:hypothetical protein